MKFSRTVEVEVALPARYAHLLVDGNAHLLEGADLEAVEELLRGLYGTLKRIESCQMRPELWHGEYEGRTQMLAHFVFTAIAEVA